MHSEVKRTTFDNEASDRLSEMDSPKSERLPA